MKAIVIREHGGPEVLQLQEVETPQLAGGDLLIRTHAIGLNYIDTYHRTGAYPMPLPFIPGRDGAGVVEAVGSDVVGFAVGDRVAWPFAPASYAELVAVNATSVVAIPDDISFDVATAAMLQGMTAHYLINSTFEVGPGHIVLIHAAAGGVGQLLVRMAHLKGARVIATVSTDAKAEIARAAGADFVIRYDQPDWTAEIKAISAGVDVVYDGVGATTFDASLASLRPRGMMVLFGAASGPVPDFDLQRLNSGGSLFITRPTLGNYIATQDEMQWRASEIFELIANGELTINVGAHFALADAAAAHIALESRKTTGKIILQP